MASFFILFTGVVEEDSPLRSGDDFSPQSLENALGDPHLIDEVQRWEELYKACDRLVMTGKDREFGYNEISNVASDLSAMGRETARAIEQHTRKLTYYYLTIGMDDPKAADGQRPCPSCGRPWRLPHRFHRLIDFKCDPCRLLSTKPLSFNFG